MLRVLACKSDRHDVSRYEYQDGSGGIPESLGPLLAGQCPCDTQHDTRHCLPQSPRMVCVYSESHGQLTRNVALEQLESVLKDPQKLRGLLLCSEMEKD